MKKSMLFILAVFILSSKLSAEILLTFPIAYFAVECDEIWEATPIQQNTVSAVFGKANVDDWNWFQVRISKVHRSAFCREGDTMWVTCGTSYMWVESVYEQEERDNSFKNDTIKRLWLFGRIYTGAEQWPKPGYVPARSPFLATASSGIRPENQNGVVFTPYQRGNPGPYFFSQGLENELKNGQEMRRCVEKNVRIADELFAFRRIQNRKTQNDSIFSWINRNKTSLTMSSRDPDSWLWNRELPFYLIYGNGEDEQAWGALLLFNQFFPDKMLSENWSTQIEETQARFKVYQKMIRPFRSASGLAFLKRKIKDVSLSWPFREHAMGLFRDVLRSNLAIEDRKQILHVLLDSYQTDTLLDKEGWIEVVQSVGIWRENERHKYLPEAFQFFIDTYKKESPGYPKLICAKVLVQETTADEWKNITGNDGRIMVYINQLGVDTTKRTLRFEVCQTHGYEPIFECPRIEIFQMNGKGKRLNQWEIPAAAFCNERDLSKNKIGSSEVVCISLDEKLPKGIWYIQASGTAGQKQEYRWTSELGKCRF
jgi:hypothetical protein